MIQYIERSEIDVEKYDFCIKNSRNSRIYAFSWYLDIVADNWAVLILNDYEAVMPLPWRSKYFIKYIYTPCWTQQLGVFSSIILKEELVQDFIDNLPKKFKKVALNLNSKNTITNKMTSSRMNYILPLNKSYKELFSTYKYVRRRCINQLNENEIKVEKTTIFQDVIRLFIDKKQNSVSLNSLDYKRLKIIMNYLKENKKVEIIIAKNNQNELLGGAFFLKDSKRITYLFSAISQEGREKQVMTFIIDSIIKQNSNSNYTLDFEGSMIPGIAFFFRSFGAQKETYFNYQKRSLF